MPDDQKQGASSTTIHAVIDRIEDNAMAVILLGDDEREQINLPLALLPGGATDGDHLRLTIKLDPESRLAAEEKVKSLQDQLEKRSGTKGQKNFKL
jgi:hypothetical protein